MVLACLSAPLKERLQNLWNTECPLIVDVVGPDGNIQKIPYGQSEGDNHIIAQALSRYGSVSDSAYGVRYFCLSPDGNCRSAPLDFYAPYFRNNTTHLAQVLKHSAEGKNKGVNPLEFDLQEESFLEGKAIPALIDHKILDARSIGSDLIRLGVKIFGIGFYGSEADELVGMMIKYLQGRTDYTGNISLEFQGFDIDLSIICGALHSIYQDMIGRVRDSGLYNRLSISYRGYYGDLISDLTLPAMLTFGDVDLAIWRRTHILYDPLLGESHGNYIVKGLKENMKKPGALVVSEGLYASDRRLYIQELV